MDVRAGSGGLRDAEIRQGRQLFYVGINKCAVLKEEGTVENLLDHKKKGRTSWPLALMMV